MSNATMPFVIDTGSRIYHTQSVIFVLNIRLFVVQIYLSRHAYGTVKHEDLYAALEEVSVCSA